MLLKLVALVALLYFVKDVVDAWPRVQAERKNRYHVGVVKSETDVAPEERNIFEDKQIYRVIAYNNGLKMTLIAPEWERRVEKRFYSSNRRIAELKPGTRFFVDHERSVVVVLGEASA